LTDKVGAYLELNPDPMDSIIDPELNPDPMDTKSGRETSISEKARRASVRIGQNRFSQVFRQSSNGISAYELYNAIFAMGVVVDLEIVVAIFKEVDKDNSGTVSLLEFSEFVLKSAELEDERQKPIRAVLKIVAFEIKFWLNFGFVVAGLLLTIAMFGHSTIPEPTLKNMILAVNSLFVMTTGPKVIIFPIDIWKERNFIEYLSVTLKDGLMQKAVNLESKRDAETCPNINSTTPHCAIREYIKTVLFRNEQGGIQPYLSREDIEGLLLNETGIVVSSSHLGTIFNSFDSINSGDITVEEVHLFMYETDYTRKTSKKISKVFHETITSVEYMLNLFFFLGGAIAIILNVTSRFDDRSIFGDTNSIEVADWLSFIGSIGFVYSNYKIKHTEYDLMESARRVLSKWILLAPYYYDMCSIWVAFNEDNGMDIDKVANLLEESRVSLPRRTFSSLVKLITHSKKKYSFISRSELETFAAKKIPRRKTVWKMCLTSYTFIGDFGFLVGATAFVLTYYIESMKGVIVLNKIGGITFLIGGVSFTYGYCDRKWLYLEHRRNLCKAMEKLTEGDVSTREMLLGT